MANDASRRWASRKASAALSYSKLCSSASPRRNGSCASGAPELANETWPTSSAASGAARSRSVTMRERMCGSGPGPQVFESPQPFVVVPARLRAGRAGDRPLQRAEEAGAPERVVHPAVDEAVVEVVVPAVVLTVVRGGNHEAALLQEKDPAGLAGAVSDLVKGEHPDEEDVEHRRADDECSGVEEDGDEHGGSGQRHRDPGQRAGVVEEVVAKDAVRMDVMLAHLHDHPAQERDVLVEPGVEGPVQQAGDEIGGVDAGEDREDQPRPARRGGAPVGGQPG